MRDTTTQTNFLNEAYHAVVDLANRHPEFTTDDVWTRLGDLYFSPTSEPRTLGSVMKRAERNGFIKASDAFLPSKRPVCNRRPVRVWRSLVYRPNNLAA